MSVQPLSAPLLPAFVPPLRGFRAFALDTSRNPVPVCNRLDFYKISLVTGHVVVQCAGRHLALRGTHLLFASPQTSYSTLLLSARVTGYACLFTPEFMPVGAVSDTLAPAALFPPGGLVVCELAGAQAAHGAGVFEEMLTAQAQPYPFRGELLAAYVQLLLLEGRRGRHRTDWA